MKNLDAALSKVKALKDQLTSTRDGDTQLSALWNYRGNYSRTNSIAWSRSTATKLCVCNNSSNVVILNSSLDIERCIRNTGSHWVLTCCFDTFEGDLVAFGGLGEQCYVHSTHSDTRVVLDTDGGYLTCCRFMGATSILGSLGSSECVLWDVEHTYKPLTVFSGHASDTMSVSVRPNSSHEFISGSCDNTCKLWDSRFPQQCYETFVGHADDVNWVEFLSCGLLFATASDDSTCRIFDLRAPGEIAAFRGVQGVDCASVAPSRFIKNIDVYIYICV
jgi:guanine nucleotide-binding protein G(I)/G(S)/G(T) subunit beta-1